MVYVLICGTGFSDSRPTVHTGSHTSKKWELYASSNRGALDSGGSSTTLLTLEYQECLYPLRLQLLRQRQERALAPIHRTSKYRSRPFDAESVH